MQAVRGWSAFLVDVDDDDESWRRTFARLGVGVGLSSVYGVALGTRDGGTALLSNAVGVPVGALAVLMLGVPALYIILSLFSAPLEPSRLAAASSRAFATAAVLWAGLAPAAALFVVTSGARSTASAVAVTGLVVGGLVGLRSLLTGLGRQLDDADSSTRHVSWAVGLGFAAFAVALAGRIWGSTLVLLGGAS
jgi:hypothetical protein